MADTFTSTLRLQQPTVGADAATWGGYLNTDLVLIDNAINGVAAINIAGLATYSLTVANGAVDQARNLVYNFTGALSADCTVTLPTNAKFGYAVNSTTGGHTVILTTGLGGTNLTLPTSAWYQFFGCDGTNVFSPSIGFGFANFLNSVTVNGGLFVTGGGSTLNGTTAAQTVTATTLTTTGTVTIGTSTYATNGDGFIPYLNANRSAIINQAVTNTSSPVFTDVGITGLGFLKSFINQTVTVASSPTFADVGITGLGFVKANLINQALLTSSGVTFAGLQVNGNVAVTGLVTSASVNTSDIFLGYYGNNISAAINQDVRSSANVVFQTVRANSSGVAFSAPSGGGQALAGWTTTSDVAFKENVETLTGALDRVCGMRGVSFDHKVLGGRHIGVIAQEMQKQRPEVVIRGDDGFLSVNYGALVAELIEATKELRAEIATLKAQLA